MISLVPAPAELSKYTLLEEIGHGGMATVFRARDRRLQRDVALKLLHRHLRESAEIEARFNSEARAVAKLRHPNIVAVHDVSSEDEEERYLVMELVRGPTLRELLRQRGRLPVEVAASIVLEIASALQHAHTEGVIHRDIKPENVLIDTTVGEPRAGEDTEGARIKLTDFGIAKLLDAQGVTSTGQVLGSPAHMAPEQIEGRPVDVRADVFSLGVLFYECIVGDLPFEGRNPAQVLRNVLEGNYQPPDRVRPEIGARWAQIVVKALQRDPNARHATISELGQAVRTELERVGMGSARREIADYLDDPEGYAEAFPDRVVGALTRSGVAARLAGQVPLATAQFNRALAYRPGDIELLRRVSGLRWRSRLQRATLAALGFGALVGAVVLLWQWWASAEKVPTHGPPEKPIAAQPAPPPERLTDRAVAVEAVPEPAVNRPNRPPRRVPRGPSNPAPEPELVALAKELRPVSVRVTGAVGGTVKIDGTERPWFGGVVHELSVGEHFFEFVPPNDSCCEATSRKVQIVAGVGTQLVVGKIPFKDAMLDMKSGAAAGWSMSCPTLFSGEMSLPGLRAVPMSQVKASGSCVLTNSEEGSATRRKVVTLAAGQTTMLPWP
jgi:serine/threonine-protein kinase